MRHRCRPASPRPRQAAYGATGPDAAARLAGQHAAHRALIPPAGVKHGQKRREDGINDSVNRRVKGRRHCRPSGAPDVGGEERLWELGLGLLPWAIRLSNVGAGTAGEERRRGMVRASQLPSGTNSRVRRPPPGMQAQPSAPYALSVRFSAPGHHRRRHSSTTVPPPAERRAPGGGGRRGHDWGGGSNC